MAPQTRSRGRTGSASGSEYRQSDASMEVDDEQAPADEEVPAEPEPAVEYSVTSRGRRITRKSYKESASEDDGAQDDEPPSPTKQEDADGAGEFQDEGDYQNTRRYSLRERTRPVRPPPKGRGVIMSDEEGEPSVNRYATRSRSKITSIPDLNGNANGGGRITRRSGARPQQQQASASALRSTRSRTLRRTRSSGRPEHDEEGYVDVPSSGSIDADGDFEEAPQTSPEPEDDADAEGELDVDGDIEQEPEQDGRPYALRQRAKINYAIPPPLEEMRQPPKSRGNGGRSNGRNGGGFGGGRSKVPGWSATGAELSRWMGGDDSDSDHPTRTPRKPFGVGLPGGMFAGGAGTGGGLFPTDLAAAAGTPSNMGKIGDALLADADPLGVKQSVTFDEVGGLDDHINSLKEMTILPLLYPEIFQRFDLTPPRGVLFHGPPGTGKTLLARALAASCRSNGRGISFFMRKGADCLSKWVGEAERQLRLLFEEARNSQPSIIFFDEIDGLAPVRSSKQDQIHASIVSTLLALMDGMDGRGQVIVIGATNRPDAVDPALRRPGRFDREFYFPLPNLEARQKILSIITRKWANWTGDKGEASVKGLAKLTKGYGGADLRALCTEATLNAVQRRYPQIYKSNDRLLLQPDTIGVELRDFMIAIKKLVPSSARSVSSAASPLPAQLVPLLQNSLDKLKDVIGKALPVDKKRSALEEAEWEDEGDEGALERELMMQSMETLRVHRPRVVLHGAIGMGQSYVAAAVLHHLEGYHVQSLDLGSLMSDSARTAEAAIVQLFVEAKRHQPSVVYIPSLLSWSAAVSETSRTTVRAMLDTLAPTDPVLLLAVVDGQFSALPRDVRAWFGSTRENRVDLPSPTPDQREEFFNALLHDVRRPPNHFPDGVKRKKRILEVLPIAPPLEPRQPSAAELAVQQENDQRVVTLLKFRLGPILTELKRKFKRFTKRAAEEYNMNLGPLPEVEVVTTSVEVRTEQNGVVEVTEQRRTEEVVGQQPVNGTSENPEPVQPPPPPSPQLFDMDLERMHVELYNDKYLTVEDFVQDIQKIVHNAFVRGHEDGERLFRAQALLTAAEVSVNDFDPQFRLECQRMAARERKRRAARRKEKGKGKAVENGQNGATYAPGTRRSARNNGQQPEMSITDPLLLERKLKRQRSNEAAATPSEDEAGERVAKRSRVTAAEDDDRDPLDLLAASPSPQRPGGVRFADKIESLRTPSPPPPVVNGVLHDMNDTPRKSGGFPPSLLNPLPSPPDIPSLIPDGDDNPFLLHEPPALPQAELPPSSDQSIQIDPPHDLAPQLTMESTSVLQPVEDPVEKPMEVERSPTPLPDFHLDEDLLSVLKTTLCNSTASLTVEQLEQLRATCLGCIWRHRIDWDRTIVTRELIDVVKEFVDEVSDDIDSPS
ncbi:AAA-domain-containing protein [Amylocystis lapponica]|nr:AAA-domain-containing protein [Amylocystis lapponica]